MLHDLDQTLGLLLHDVAAPAALMAAEVAFDTPGGSFGPQQGDTAINLFLYEVRENRELRNVAPIRDIVAGVAHSRRPPIRVDCAYRVTAWSKSVTQIADEHNLLGIAFAWLSRFDVVPSAYLSGSLIGQPFAPPSMLSQWDGAHTSGEFWTALGIPPRPFFNLIVTVAMDLDRVVEDSIVTTIATHYHASNATNAEELMIIGGTVRDQANNAVGNAWVRLEPAGLIQVADANGRFIFSNIARGAGYSLSARAPGHATPAELINFEIPSLTGDYDLQFPN